MWDDGLIYRKKRIINWCVYSQTALSDVEVEFKEVKGNLWFIQYPWVTPPDQIPSAEPRTLPADAHIVKADNHSRIVITRQPHEALERGARIMIDTESWVVFKILPNVKHYSAPDELKSATHNTHGIALLLPSVNTSAHTIVATTRPETLLGDVSNAANELYNFTWGIFCDWYLEIAKVVIDKGDEMARSKCSAVLQSCFREILILLHPLVPFITEELYQKLPGLKRGDSLCLEEWPSINDAAPRWPDDERGARNNCCYSFSKSVHECPI